MKEEEDKDEVKDKDKKEEEMGDRIGLVDKKSYRGQ